VATMPADFRNIRRRPVTESVLAASEAPLFGKLLFSVAG